jgi:hypothetical protein
MDGGATSQLQATGLFEARFPIRRRYRGRALKTNQAQEYIQQIASEKGTVPDYYLEIPGRKKQHSVLLCMPLQNPNLTNQAYGVMCCGGYSRSSALWEVMHEEREKHMSRLQTLQQALNSVCFDMLKNLF